MFFFFFFSSRRRHTRFDCDWSSDVCSSDLLVGRAEEMVERGVLPRVEERELRRLARGNERSEEHTSDSSHSQISYAVFCLKKKKHDAHRTVSLERLVAWLCTSRLGSSTDAL